MTPEPPETFACPKCSHPSHEHRISGCGMPSSDNTAGWCPCRKSEADVLWHHLTESRAALRAAEAILRQSHAIPVDSEAAAYLHGIIDQCVQHLAAAVPRPEGETP